MSMCICDMCNTFINTDAECGEWDIQDRDGNGYDFVCENCAANSEEFIRCDECDELTTDDNSTEFEESCQIVCDTCIKKDHDQYLKMYIAETGKNPYKKVNNNG